MKKPRIAFKPSVPSPEVASARLRCYLPMHFLRSAGWDCEAFKAEHANDYDVVVFQKAYTRDDLDLAAALRARGTRVVFDLCDNHLYNPDSLPELSERAERLRRMLDLADEVSVCTDALARHLPRASHVIDDVLDTPRRDLLAPLRSFSRSLRKRLMPDRLRLVWFGNAGMDSPPFGLIDLAMLVPTLNNVHRTLPLSLTVISNDPARFHRYTAGVAFPLRYRTFHTRSFQRQFRGYDLCLIPVTPNPFTECKTVNRPALSLLLGVPVVADFIASYEELRPYVLGEDWAGSILRYARDPALRRQHVADGQQYLRTHYTPQRVVEQWSSLFTRLVA